MELAPSMNWHGRSMNHTHHSAWGDVCLMEDSYILVLDFILVYG
jgi:hypothetical protein